MGLGFLDFEAELLKDPAFLLHLNIMNDYAEETEFYTEIVLIIN